MIHSIGCHKDFHPSSLAIKEHEDSNIHRQVDYLAIRDIIMENPITKAVHYTLVHKHNFTKDNFPMDFNYFTL